MLSDEWKFDLDIVENDIILYAKWISLLPEKFAGGIGTPEDPYQIENEGHLHIVRNHLEKHFIQIADIDLHGLSLEEGWDPIGVWYGDGYSENQPFTGSFDGKGYMIKNLVINRPGSKGVGLFGYTNNAIIKNILLENVDVLGSTCVGGLIGMNNSSENITNCTVSGTVQGWDEIGGLIGKNSGGTIVASKAFADVVGSYSVGGLVGLNWYGEILNGCAQGDVTGSSMTGGLVGDNYDGSIYDSCASGNVDGGSETGGLAGRSISGGRVLRSWASGVVTGGINTGGLIGYGSGITDSYSKGNVEGTEKVGGLIGLVSGGGLIKHSYASGTLIGSTGVGGLIGALQNGTVENSFYDSETSGRSDMNQGIPRTTEEMMQQTTFIDWDFTGVWAIDEGTSYPYLQWETK
jgi:hypothetical protein